jgi:hypothetical protein
MSAHRHSLTYLGRSAETWRTALQRRPASACPPTRARLGQPDIAGCDSSSCVSRHGA